MTTGPAMEPVFGPLPGRHPDPGALGNLGGICSTRGDILLNRKAHQVPAAGHIQSPRQGAFFAPRQVPQALHHIKVPALPQISKRVERNVCLGFSGAGAVPKTPKPQRLQSPAAHPLPSPHGLTRPTSLTWEDRVRLPPRLVSRCPPLPSGPPEGLGFAPHRPPAFPPPGASSADTRSVRARPAGPGWRGGSRSAPRGHCWS